MMLSLGTAYRSFGGEVEASSTPTICRLSDSRRHQLWAIARLARPGGNFTGLSSMSSDLLTKRIALLKEAVPKISRLAVLLGPQMVQSDVDRAMAEYAKIGSGLQVSFEPVMANSIDELPTAFSD